MNIQIGLQIIGLLILLYLALIKSYFQEKGKNLATSEDIEGLTSKVETVKQQFIEKNATLKAKLDLLTNIQISHKNEERLAIINFHTSIKKWINLLISTSLPLKDDYNNEEIKLLYTLYENTYKEVLTSISLLELYTDNNELYKIINNLKIETLTNLGTQPYECIIKLQHNNIDLEHLNLEENIDLKKEKHSELLEVRKVIYENYRNSMMEGLVKNISIEKDYNNYIRDYLKSLSE